MIQGGDPSTKDPKAPRGRHGTGGPGFYRFGPSSMTRIMRAESCRMARANDPDSAGSQFFICVADSGFLDRQYTAFGRVVRGMETADSIVNLPRDARDNPNDRVEMTVKVVDPA